MDDFIWANFVKTDEDGAVLLQDAFHRWVRWWVAARWVYRTEDGRLYCTVYEMDVPTTPQGLRKELESRWGPAVQSLRSDGRRYRSHPVRWSGFRLIAPEIARERARQVGLPNDYRIVSEPGAPKYYGQIRGLEYAYPDLTGETTTAA